MKKQIDLELFLETVDELKSQYCEKGKKRHAAVAEDIAEIAIRMAREEDMPRRTCNVEPCIQGSSVGFDVYRCGWCGKQVRKEDFYCRTCGKPVRLKADGDE